MQIQQIIDPEEKAQIAQSILNDLPDWFGLPESTANYISDSRGMPFWAALIDAKAAGFIALKETSPKVAEIFVMGVSMQHHRKGIGHALFDALRAYAAEHGYAFMQVKTVQKGRYEAYDRTCCFYESLGFDPFECFPTLWDEANPCQVYVMAVK